ncbi:MAG: hypothetical protein IKJ77_07570 [Firmicutes bacterium]|nr:hypothetical protein [Bacillota bacterium]
MDKKKKRFSRSCQAGALLLIFVLLLSLSVGLHAKYIDTEDKDVAAIAKNFYFESDLLTASTGAMPQYTLEAGVDDITFVLRNYPDELRESEVDIHYEVTLEKEGVTKEKKTGELKINQKVENITFSDLEPGVYEVKAKATKPYVSLLHGRFTLIGIDEELYYSVSDAPGSPNIKVTITTTDYAGTVKISWPDGVLPDNTEEMLETAKGKNCEITVKAQSEYVLQFFKEMPSKDYTTKITVTKDIV